MVILRKTCPYLEFSWSAFSSNARKYKPEKLWIETFFTQCYLLTINILMSAVQRNKCIPNHTCTFKLQICLTLPWRRPLPYRNQSIDLQSKSVGWFLYDRGLRHETVNGMFFKWNPETLRIWYFRTKIEPWDSGTMGPEVLILYIFRTTKPAKMLLKNYSNLVSISSTNFGE